MKEKAEGFHIFILVDERASWKSTCVRNHHVLTKIAKKRLFNLKVSLLSPSSEPFAPMKG